MLVCTLNSAVASGDGTKLRLLGWFVSVPVFGTPSSRNSLVKPRPPLIWKLSMPPLSNGRFERLAVAGVYCTPGDSWASMNGLRPSSGRSATCSRPMTWPRLALPVSRIGASERTVTSSVTAPSCIDRSRRRRSPTRTSMPSRLVVVNPFSVTVSVYRPIGTNGST